MTQPPRILAASVACACLIGLPSSAVSSTPRPQAAAVAAARSVAAPAVPLQVQDGALRTGLLSVLHTLGVERLVAQGRMAAAVVDLTRPDRARYAAVNGDRMMYAASLPKIAILLGAFDALSRGRLADTPALREAMTQMIRVSSNTAATEVLRRVGFAAVAETLTSPRLGLYDAAGSGGLWVGKAYGRDSYWRRDPVAQLSHGATARQAARFFVLMDRGLLISPEVSARIKEILGDPGIHHKFVRGLDSRPGATIYRKSGTWEDFNADAALVVRPDARYVLVGLVQDAAGEGILQRLAPAVDDLVRRRPGSSSVAAR